MVLFATGSKVKWLLDHVPAAKAGMLSGKAAFGTMDTWLAWKLTGGKTHVTGIELGTIVI